MQFRLSDAIAVLERTPAVLDAWLRPLPERWTYSNEGGAVFVATSVQLLRKVVVNRLHVGNVQKCKLLHRSRTATEPTGQHMPCMCPKCALISGGLFLLVSLN